MKVLITGGTGFIGHQIACTLERLGIQVIAVDGEYNASKHNNEELLFLKSERIKKWKNTTSIPCDIINQHHLTGVFESTKPDVVIHCASAPRQKTFEKDVDYYSRTMVEGLIHTLEASVSAKVSKFVFVSSSMVYGNFVDYVTEDTICNPVGHYGILKLAGENLVKDYTRRYNLPHVIIRPSAVYGPYDYSDRVIGKFFTNAFNNQTLLVHGKDERLDFSYIDDVAEGIVKASLCNVKNNTYNLTKGESFSLLEAAKIVIDTVGGGNIKVIDKDKNFPSRGALSIIKAQRDFGYDPKTSLWEGIKKQYEWLSNTTLWSTASV